MARLGRSQPFKPLIRGPLPPAGAGSTGTLATTNADDTSAAIGTTTIVGALAYTNANDASAAAGTTTVLGTLARANANDTAAASGTTAVVGTSATTNANDTSTASGSGGAVTGTSATTNANDVANASGSGGPRSDGAGRSKSKRRRMVVEIDGEEIFVDTVEEAEALLAKVRQEAEAKAETQLKRATSAPKRRVQKVLADAVKFLAVPQITVSPELGAIADMAARLQRDIQAHYQSVLDTIEISTLLRRKQLQDEDDEDVLLMLL